MGSGLRFTRLVAAMLAVSLPLWCEVEAKPVRLQTESGLTLFYFHDASSAITHLCLAMPLGKKQEPLEGKGLSFLLNRLVLEVPNEDQAVDMLEMGARVSCDVYGDYSLITLRTLSVYFEDSLKVVAEGVSRPLFSGIRISFIKEQMDLYRQAEKDEVALRGEIVHLGHFFGSAGYGGSVFGIPASVKAIAKKDLVALHKRCFGKKGIRLAVVTDLPQERVAALLDRALRSLPDGDAEPPPGVPSSPAAERSFQERRENRQTLVSLAFLLPAFSVENHVLGVLAETLLGKGIESRLWRLRSQERLAYNVQAKLLSLHDAGMLTVSLWVSPEKREEALRLLVREIDRLQEEGVSPEELEKTRRLAEVDYLKRVEAKDRRAASLLFFDIMGAGFSLAADFPEHLRRPNATALNGYLRRILAPENRSQVIIGPGEAALQGQ